MARFQSDRFMRNIRTLADVRADRSTARTFGRNLKQFFIDIWLDIAVLVVIGITTGGVWVAPHTFTRLFPITFFDHSGDIVWTQFAYPYISPPLNATLVGLVCGLVPLAIILIAQIWVRSFIDAANAILGLAYALLTGTLFQVIIKKTIGGLRPHFLTVCEPQLPQNIPATGTGYQNIMFTIEQVCKGDMAKINNAIESFPSGHSQIAWAGLGYLAIYLFAHLRIQTQRRPSLWRMAFVLSPLLLATYLASTLVLSYNHHGYDVLAGGLIGIIVAAFSYRMVFMSVWKRSWNCVPRCRYTEFDGPGSGSGPGFGLGRRDGTMQRELANVEPRKSSADTVVNDGQVLPK